MSSRALKPAGRAVSVVGVLLRLAPPALVALCFAAVGIVHVSSRVLAVDVGYKLSRAEQLSRELQREHDRLKLELATLKSPARLEALAREQLQMVPPPAGAVLSVAQPESPSAHPERSRGAIESRRPQSPLDSARGEARQGRDGRELRSANRGPP